MNSLSTFIRLLVVGFAVFTSIAGLPSQGSSYGNELGSDSPWRNPPRNCGIGEKPSACDANPSCQKTCDNYDRPIACTRSAGPSANICWPGCVCKDGFVRVAQGEQCIPISKCEGRVKH